MSERGWKDYDGWLAGEQVRMVGAAPLRFERRPTDLPLERSTVDPAKAALVSVAVPPWWQRPWLRWRYGVRYRRHVHWTQEVTLR